MPTFAEHIVAVAQFHLQKWNDAIPVGPARLEQLRDFYRAHCGASTTANWCACFTSRVVFEAAQSNSLNAPKSAGARAWGKKALAMGWSRIGPDVLPMPGDVAIFWRVSPDSWQGHIGIVVSVNAVADTFTTIEGNTGKAVRKRVHQRSEPALLYFARPPHSVPRY